MEAARERRNIASAQLKKGRSGIEECQLSGATLYYVGACGPDPCRNELQLEGVIAERKSSLEPGTRNGAWLKYKINRSQECYWRLHPWHQSIRRFDRRLLRRCGPKVCGEGAKRLCATPKTRRFPAVRRP